MARQANRVVDAWMQLPTQNFMKQPYLQSLFNWGTGQVPKLPSTSQIVQNMKASKVDVGLVSAWYGPQGTILSNEEVREACATAPDNLFGIASADIRDPVAAVATLRTCVNEWGFKGFRFLGWLWDLPPTDRRLYPIYTTCVELDVPICLQVGHTGPLCPSEWGRPIPYIDRIALDFPQLKIVGGHVGYPWTEEMVACARKYPNVYIDTSAWKPSRYPPELTAFLKTRTGARKVMFGTNYPMLPHSVCVEEVKELGLSEETTAAFLGGTACKLFKLNRTTTDSKL